MIATDYFGPAEPGQPGRVRAYAAYDDALIAKHRGMAFGALGSGLFAILIDQGRGTAPYQGITPLAGGSLAACAETYFAQSEQLPTRFRLATAEAPVDARQTAWRGGGVMVQLMPEASPHAAQEASGEGGLLTADDLLDGDAAETWNRVNTLLDTTCSAEEISAMTTPSGTVTADCQFCGAHYEFAPESLGIDGTG